MKIVVATVLSFALLTIGCTSDKATTLDNSRGGGASDAKRAEQTQNGGGKNRESSNDNRNTNSPSTYSAASPRK